MVIRGDFNAHFTDKRVTQDGRASLLTALSNILNLHELNWSAQVQGEFTWGSKDRKSTLDSILPSQA